MKCGGSSHWQQSSRCLYVCFVNSYSSCCWISLSRYGNGGWLVSTTVNLTRRSDNGQINSSPVSRSPAILRWHEGCPQSLRIPVEDADGDVVKCRLASYSESSIHKDSFPYGNLDEVIENFRSMVVRLLLVSVKIAKTLLLLLLCYSIRKK